jgi:tRNA (guanine37-N1)-methyltransferase
VRFVVLTLFPSLIRAVAGESILGRACAAGLLSVDAVDIRDFAGNAYGKVDDAPYGGGRGMLLQCGPVFDAWRAAGERLGAERPHTVFLSPQGRPFDQRKAEELAGRGAVVLLCGHYEGVDQRVLDEIVDEEISLGDFVLTGGELPALAVIDAVARLIPGVLPDESAYREESHGDGLLEHPHYTRPAEWHGRSVPDVLLSGHHERIVAWRRKMSLVATMRKRPDLFGRIRLEKGEGEALAEFLSQDD